MTHNNIITHDDNLKFNVKTHNWQNQTSTEKEIETEIYAQILNYYTTKYKQEHKLCEINYSNPDNIDGIIDLLTINEDRRILIEAKRNLNFNQTDALHNTLTQALHYCYILQTRRELLPAAIILASAHSISIIKTTNLHQILNSNHNWSSTPNTQNANITAWLKTQNIQHTTLQLNNSFSLAEFFDNLDVTIAESPHHRTKHIVEPAHTEPETLDILEDIECYYNETSQNWHIYNETTGVWEHKNQYELRKTFIAKLTSELPNWSKRAIVRAVELTLEKWHTTRTSNTCTPNKNILTFTNGSVDLTTKQLTAHDPEYYQTVVVNAQYSKQTNPSISPETLNFTKEILLNSASPLPDTVSIYAITGDKAACQKFCDLLSKLLNNHVLLRSLSATMKYDASKHALAIFDGWDSKTSSNGSYDYTNVLSFGGCVVVTMPAGQLVQQSNLPITTQVLELESSVRCDDIDTVASAAVNCDEISLQTLQAWNETHDLIQTWFDEYIKADTGSFILTKDALDSYNSWALDRDNSKLSMRTFITMFTSHKTFRDSKAKHEPRKYLKKEEGYTQSQYYPENGEEARTPARIDSMFMNIAFK